MLIKEYKSLWHRIFSEGPDSGEFDPRLDPRVVVQGLLGMCTGFLSWFRPDGRLPVQEVAHVFSEIAPRGVQAHDAAPNDG